MVMKGSHYAANAMMTSSNGNIFRVTCPLCGEFTGPGEFPTQRPVTRSFDVCFDLRLNKRLSKRPWGWWFETPPWSLWRHCNGTDKVMACAYSASSHYLDYCQLDSWKQVSVKFESKFYHIHSRKCFWKCRLRNWQRGWGWGWGWRWWCGLGMGVEWGWADELNNDDLFQVRLYMLSGFDVSNRKSFAQSLRKLISYFDAYKLNAKLIVTTFFDHITHELVCNDSLYISHIEAGWHTHTRIYIYIYIYMRQCIASSLVKVLTIADLL